MLPWLIIEGEEGRTEWPTGVHAMDKPTPSEVPASHWDEAAQCLPCEGTGKVTKWRRGLQEAERELAFEAFVENVINSKFWENDRRSDC